MLFSHQWAAGTAAGGKGPAAAAAADGGWKLAFLSRLRRSQANFLAKAPALVKKCRRKDGLPDLRKLHDALRIKYSLTIGSGASSRYSSAAPPTTLRLSQESAQVFHSAVCLRCSFSSLKLRPPLRVEVKAHSAGLGTEQVVLATEMRDEASWGEGFAADENFRFLRSPCGRLLLGVWCDGGAVAGLFASLHHLQVVGPLLRDSPAARQILVSQPPPDDLDSQLGLHDYTLMLTLRGVRLEAFSNTFYRVNTLRGDAFGEVCVPGGLAISQHAAVGAAEAAAAAARQAPAASPGPRRGGRAGSAGEPRAAPAAAAVAAGRRVEAGAHCAAMAHLEVLPPHESGSRPPFPCVRPLELVFQSLAFKSVFHDTCFADATVIDEQGHIIWATSAAVALQSAAPPHEAVLTAQRFAEIDFDRDAAFDMGFDSPRRNGRGRHRRGGGPPVRWLCLADRGAAQLVVQLEYASGGGEGGDEHAAPNADVPRLNAVTWHPELAFLDAWWGSSYAKK